MIVYVVLGTSLGEWRPWVEGVFTDQQRAREFQIELESDNAKLGWGNSFSIKSAALQTGVAQ